MWQQLESLLHPGNLSTITVVDYGIIRSIIQGCHLLPRAERGSGLRSRRVGKGQGETFFLSE